MTLITFCLFAPLTKYSFKVVTAPGRGWRGCCRAGCSSVLERRGGVPSPAGNPHLGEGPAAERKAHTPQLAGGGRRGARGARLSHLQPRPSLRDTEEPHSVCQEPGDPAAPAAPMSESLGGGLPAPTSRATPTLSLSRDTRGGQSTIGGLAHPRLRIEVVARGRRAEALGTAAAPGKVGYSRSELAGPLWGRVRPGQRCAGA